MQEQDQLREQVKKYKKYAIFFLLISIISTVIILPSLHLVPPPVFILLGIPAFMTGIYFRKYQDALKKKAGLIYPVLQDFPAHIPEEDDDAFSLRFRINKAGKELVNRLAKEMGISEADVWTHALRVYATIVDQFSEATGTERIIEVVDGKTLRKAINVAEVMPLPSSDVKIIN